MIDFSFVVLVVLSLFAILFTFDAITGERESGTLKQVFANSVSRATYLLAKLTGAWLGLVLPVMLPILLGILLVMLYQGPTNAPDWTKVTALIGAAILFFTLFITLGALISALSRRSSVSFLMSLAMWVAFVLVLPRAGVMAAGQMVHVPRVAEIEGQRDGYAKGLWADFYEDMEQRLHHERKSGEEGNDDAAMWRRMEREDSLRRDVEQMVQAYESKLFADLRNKKAAQERLALTLSRLSPASAFQLAAMNLAGTDITLKSRSREAMSDYREHWSEYVNQKREETGEEGGFVSIEVSSEDGIKIGTGSDDNALDLSEMPQYEPPQVKLSEALSLIIPDLGILCGGILLSFLGAFLAFLRYDVR